MGLGPQQPRPVRRRHHHRPDNHVVTPVNAANGWLTVTAAGNHSVAHSVDGTLWAWGANDSGQAGDGTNTDRLSPTQVGTDVWSTYAAGSDHSVAHSVDGTLWAWGANDSGQLGDGTTDDRTTPTRIGTRTWATVTAGGHHTIARRTT